MIFKVKHIHRIALIVLLSYFSVKWITSKFDVIVASSSSSASSSLKQLQLLHLVQQEDVFPKNFTSVNRTMCDSKRPKKAYNNSDILAFGPNKKLGRIGRGHYDETTKMFTRWVLVEEYRIIKHLNSQNDYNHEKSISIKLGKHDGFVTLLGYDDTCKLLYFERIFPSKNVFGMQSSPNRQYDTNENKTKERNNNEENEDKREESKKTKLDANHVTRQINNIFSTLNKELIVPSKEFLRPNYYKSLAYNNHNLMIGEEQNITLYDFHLFKDYSSSSKSPELVELTTQTNAKIEHDLLRVIIKGESIETNPDRKRGV